MIVGLKPRLALAAVTLLAGGAVAAWAVRDIRAENLASADGPVAPTSAPAHASPTPPPGRARLAWLRLSSAAPAFRAPPPAPTPQACDDPAYMGDAVANAVSLGAADPVPGGVVWAAYAPLVGREIGSACPPDSPGFAHRLAIWRGEHHLSPAGGDMDAPTLAALTGVWTQRRPFARASAGHVCPAAAPETALAVAGPEEGYGGKTVRLVPGALDSYRRMVADARARVPAARADTRLFALVSGWRGPEEEAARCADGSCDGKTKSACSAHRTGTAVDLYLGAPSASVLGDRAADARTPAYLWLVANADRYGFVPYPYEPWHWEWTGGDV